MESTMSSRSVRLLVASGLLIAGVILAGRPLQAHHAVAGVYDLNKEIVMEGKLKKLNFVNPHASIVLTVEDKKTRKLVDWTLTTASVTSLTLQGFGKSTIKPGDPLKVTILPAVNGNPAGYIRRISLGDKDFKFDVE
jgi:hypothetical protein